MREGVGPEVVGDVQKGLALRPRRENIDGAGLFTFIGVVVTNLPVSTTVADGGRWVLTVENAEMGTILYIFIPFCTECDVFFMIFLLILDMMLFDIFIRYIIDYYRIMIIVKVTI
jgi:hypothetical protein